MLEYWLDASMFSGWRRPARRVPFQPALLAADLGVLRRPGLPFGDDLWRVPGWPTTLPAYGTPPVARVRPGAGEALRGNGRGMAADTADYPYPRTGASTMRIRAFAADCIDRGTCPLLAAVRHRAGLERGSLNPRDLKIVFIDVEGGASTLIVTPHAGVGADRHRLGATGRARRAADPGRGAGRGGAPDRSSDHDALAHGPLRRCGPAGEADADRSFL